MPCQGKSPGAEPRVAQEMRQQRVGHMTWLGEADQPGAQDPQASNEV